LTKVFGGGLSSLSAVGASGLKAITSYTKATNPKEAGKSNLKPQPTVTIPGDTIRVIN
jgi:hypothetical protein